MEPLSARAYHERTKHSPRSVRQGAGLDFDNKPTPYTRYTDLPQIWLPEPLAPDVPALEAIQVHTPQPPRTSPFPADEPAITRSILSSLCHFSAGITKEIPLGQQRRPFRAAACTGALYHIDLFVVAGPRAGIDPGVYHYDPETHAFDELRQGDYRGIVARATGKDRVATAPASVISTSTWWRNAWKYRERTFRHAFWDSGTALANLLATAHAHGLTSSVMLGFADDPIVHLLGLDPTDTAPLEIVPIGHGDPAPGVPEVEEISPNTEQLSPDPTTYEAIYRAWSAGTLSDGETAAAWRETAKKGSDRSHGAGSRENTIDLDPVDAKTASARPLGNTIQRRGSCRRYTHEPITFRQFSTVLDRAVAGLPTDVHSPVGPTLAFTDLYALVHAVEGISPGVYRVHPNTGQLELHRDGLDREESRHLALDQALGGDAAVCLYFMANLNDTVERLGDRGYRIAQFEAAMTAGRLYLATYAHRELGGTGLTFYDDLVSAFLDTDETPMFLYTIGHPA